MACFLLLNSAHSNTDPSEITVTFRDANGSQRQVIHTQPGELLQLYIRH